MRYPGAIDAAAEREIKSLRRQAARTSRRLDGEALFLVEAVADAAEGSAQIGPEVDVAVDQRLAAELGSLVVEADGPALHAVLGRDQHAAVAHLGARAIAPVLVHDAAGEVDSIDGEAHDADQ